MSTPIWQVDAFTNEAFRGKQAMVGIQASSRVGAVMVELAGDHVTLAGPAVTTLRGELQV